jgi:hypothetical protein
MADILAILRLPAAEADVADDVRAVLAQPFVAQLVEQVAYTDLAWSRVYRVRQGTTDRTLCSWCDGSKMGLRWIGA